MFAGNSNPALVKEICDCLGIGQGDALVSMFSDGEIRVQINENVRGKDVFLCQSCCDPVNKHLMELLLMLDALKRSSAYRITAVIPYYGYGRQDRKDQPRVPISALLLDDMIDTAGTITQGAQACLEHGARRVWSACTHPVLSGQALDRLNASRLEEVVVTNTIPLNGKDRRCAKLKVLSVASLLAEAIKRIHEEESVSSLFV